MVLCLVCVRIIRGSLLNNAYSHISQQKLWSKNPRICILINLLTFETQTHTMIWKQVSKGPPFAEVGPSAKMLPLHTQDGTIAASGLTCPRRGGGPPCWSHLRGAALGQESREQLQQSSQHSAPKSCGQHPDSTQGTLKTMVTTPHLHLEVTKLQEQTFNHHPNPQTANLRQRKSNQR